MKIAIDYRLAAQHGGGMAVYIKNISKLLINSDITNEYSLIDNNYHPQKGFGRGWYWALREQIWLQSQVPRLFETGDFDVGFFPNPPVPVLVNKPIILTIADVAFWWDKGIPWWARWYLWTNYFISAKKAQVIITFSTNSQRDIARILRVNLYKIHVVPLAPAMEIKQVANELKISNTLQKYGINRPYLISVPGTFIPRKNVKDLLAAFREVLIKDQQCHQLVIVGENLSQGFKETEALAEKMGIATKTIFTGRVNNEELSCLYSGADLFICTSLYEGFGLPLLEAMKCGTPVIAYNNSSLPEVIGKAGILVTNQLELAKETTRVLGNKKLLQKLKVDGSARAKMYSWEKTVEMIAKIINST